MPVLVNPYLSFGVSGPVDLTEPWGEVGRASVSSNVLTLSGLDLSGLLVVRLFITGVTVATDDSTISLRFLVGGSVVTSSTYQYTIRRQSNSTGDQVGGDTSASSFALTSVAAAQGVGNASTEAFHAVVTIYDVASTSLYKKCVARSAYSIPSGDLMHVVNGGGGLLNTGALTGFTVFGSSNLTAGTLIALGVE